MLHIVSFTGLNTPYFLNIFYIMFKHRSSVILTTVHQTETAHPIHGLKASLHYLTLSFVHFIVTDTGEQCKGGVTHGGTMGRTGHLPLGATNYSDLCTSC